MTRRALRIALLAVLITVSGCHNPNKSNLPNLNEPTPSQALPALNISQVATWLASTNSWANETVRVEVVPPEFLAAHPVLDTEVGGVRVWRLLEKGGSTSIQLPLPSLQELHGLALVPGNGSTPEREGAVEIAVTFQGIDNLVIGSMRIKESYKLGITAFDPPEAQPGDLVTIRPEETLPAEFLRPTASGPQSQPSLQVEFGTDLASPSFGSGPALTVRVPAGLPPGDVDLKLVYGLYKGDAKKLHVLPQPPPPKTMPSTAASTRPTSEPVPVVTISPAEWVPANGKWRRPTIDLNITPDILSRHPATHVKVAGFDIPFKMPESKTPLSVPLPPLQDLQNLDWAVSPGREPRRSALLSAQLYLNDMTEPLSTTLSVDEAYTLAVHAVEPQKAIGSGSLTLDLTEKLPAQISAKVRVQLEDAAGASYRVAATFPKDDQVQVTVPPRIPVGEYQAALVYGENRPDDYVGPLSEQHIFIESTSVPATGPKAVTEALSMTRPVEQTRDWRDWLPWVVLVLVVATVALLSLLGRQARQEKARLAEAEEQRQRLMEELRQLSAGPTDRADAAGQDRTPEVPPELAQACAEGRCVLYAGAGVGAQAGQPTWSQALKLILDRAEKQFPDKDWTLPKRAWEGGDPNEAAAMIRAQLDGDDLRRLVGEVFAGPTGSSEGPTFHRAVRRLPLAGIVTHNWDRLSGALLQPVAATSRPSEVLLPSDSDRFISLLRERAPFILRLYGSPDAKTDGGFLFTPDDYRRAVHEREDFGKFLETLYQSNVILFVGTSLAGIEDALYSMPATIPRVGSAEARHYALVPHLRDMDVQREKFRRRYGINLIPFAPSTGFSEVVEFVEDLEGRASRRGSPAGGPEIGHEILRRVRLKNIGAFKELDLEITPSWTVLLGNNGCGKSTVLRAIALGLSADEPKAQVAAGRLLRTAEGEDVKEGVIELTTGRPGSTAEETYRTTLRREGAKVRVECSRLTPVRAGRWVILGFPPVRGVSLRGAAARDSAAMRSPNPEVEDVLPLISGSVDSRLDDLKQWVIDKKINSDAQFAKSEQAAKANERLLTAFFDLLAEMTPGVEVELDHVDTEAKQVYVRTQDGAVVPIELLSQGTSSIFGWVGTLLQRVYQIHDKEEDAELMPALVLVDEIDAHMHPEWQRVIVPLVRERFPKLQVVASTHSPLVVGALGAGELYHLRREEGHASGGVSIERIDRQLQGFRADQILISEAFDLPTSVSVATETRMQDYSKLMGSSRRTPKEEARFQELARELGDRTPPSDDKPERQQALKLLEEFMLGKLKNEPEERRRQILREAELILSKAAVETNPDDQGAV